MKTRQHQILLPTFDRPPAVSENSVSSWKALFPYGARAVATVAPHTLHHVQVPRRRVLHDGSGAPGLANASSLGALVVLHSFVPEGKLTLLWTVRPFASYALSFPDNFFCWSIVGHAANTWKLTEDAFLHKGCIPFVCFIRCFLMTVTSEEGSI